jgi:hypothetical protein
MYYTDKYFKLNDTQFLRVTGLKKKQFDSLLGLLTDYVNLAWSSRGRKDSKFSLSDKLLITLRYLRDYPTFLVLGNEFDISESYAHKIFTKVSFALVRILKLPDVQGLTLDTIIIDVTKQKEPRNPKNTQQQLKYSGKQKCHTDKALIVYSLELNLIFHVYTDKGSAYDFKMFKQSNIWTTPHIQGSKNQL